jgi:sporulation protein YlmC with PRC-barrel domain
MWAIVCMALSTSLVAQVTTPAQPGYPDDATSRDRDGDRTIVQGGEPTRVDKASGLVGMDVKDAQGETLGKIDDVVIDFESGNVAYLVMSTGGLLGIGEKRLAVPLKAFTASGDRTSSDAHLMLRADKDSISRAEGIGDHWPSTRNPSFGAMPFWQEPEGRSSNPNVNPDLRPDPDPTREPDRPRRLEPLE